MDVQSICHNRSQLIIPQENHRTFVRVDNWICAAEVRQPHDPACSSHLCLPRAPKAPSMWPQGTRSKGSTARRAVSVLPSSLVCPVKSPVEKNTSSLDKLYGGGLYSLYSILLLPRFLESGAIEKKQSHCQRYHVQKTWFVAIHTPLWESIWSLTQQTASASKYLELPFSTPEDTVKYTFKTYIHCEVSEKSLYVIWSESIFKCSEKTLMEFMICYYSPTFASPIFSTVILFWTSFIWTWFSC